MHLCFSRHASHISNLFAQVVFGINLRSNQDHMSRLRFLVLEETNRVATLTWLNGMGLSVGTRSCWLSFFTFRSEIRWMKLSLFTQQGSSVTRQNRAGQNGCFGKFCHRWRSCRENYLKWWQTTQMSDEIVISIPLYLDSMSSQTIVTNRLYPPAVTSCTLLRNNAPVSPSTSIGASDLAWLMFSLASIHATSASRALKNCNLLTTESFNLTCKNNADKGINVLFHL